MTLSPGNVGSHSTFIAAPLRSLLSFNQLCLLLLLHELMPHQIRIPAMVVNRLQLRPLPPRVLTWVKSA